MFGGHRVFPIFPAQNLSRATRLRKMQGGNPEEAYMGQTGVDTRRGTTPSKFQAQPRHVPMVDK